MSLITSEVPNKLVVTYLEMTSQQNFLPAYLSEPTHIDIMLVEVPDVAFYQFLYTSVGERWYWRDRFLLSNKELEALLAQPERSIYVSYMHGAPAGYIELVRSADSTKIDYFGLRQPYIGQGLGKHLLSYGIDRAWETGVNRVWLHTCNLDSPYALSNYLKRGFRIYKTHEQPMPEEYR